MQAREKRRDETRQALLSVAAREFRVNGFRSSGVDAVLASTGVTKGALYHHFASKRELGLAVVDEVYRPAIVSEWSRGLSQSDDPVNDLRQMLDRRAGQGTSEIRLGCPLNNMAQEMASVDDVFQSRIEAAFEAWRQTIIDALNRGKTTGKVRENVDTRQAAVFVVAVIEGATGMAKSARDPLVLKSSLMTLKMFAETLRPGSSLRASHTY